MKSKKALMEEIIQLRKQMIEQNNTLIYMKYAEAKNKKKPIGFFNPITRQNYYLTKEDIDKGDINAYQPVRTLVQLNDGNWYCEETEKIYQLTEVVKDPE